MARLGRKHFEDVARVMAGAFAANSAGTLAEDPEVSDGRDARAGYVTALDVVARAMADVFATENDAFDRERFYAACEGREARWITRDGAEAAYCAGCGQYWPCTVVTGRKAYRADIVAQHTPKARG